MAYDAFLKIEGIDGQCTDDKHQKWIEILSYSHGISQPVSSTESRGGGRSAARCDHSPFSVVKALDKASPKLNLFCCNGNHIPSVIVELCMATGAKTKYMEYKMTDVIISSVRPGGSSSASETLPLEEVSLNYGKIEWTYTEIDPQGKPKGNVNANWDLVTNKGS
jgi:type VI secretion system secreted protein Hcp